MSDLGTPVHDKQKYREHKEEYQESDLEGDVDDSQTIGKRPASVDITDRPRSSSPSSLLNAAKMLEQLSSSSPESKVRDTPSRTSSSSRSSVSISSDKTSDFDGFSSRSSPNLTMSKHGSWTIVSERGTPTFTPSPPLGHSSRRVSPHSDSGTDSQSSYDFDQAAGAGQSPKVIGALNRLQSLSK